MFVIPPNAKKINKEAFGNRISTARSNNKITLVLLGKETDILSDKYDTLYDVSLIYCLPGSKAQKYAREHNIPMKPLSEFNMADYNT